MADSIRFTPSSDPLYRDVPLEYSAVIPVLGIPVRFESNALRIIQAAEEAFGAWRVLERAHPMVSDHDVRVALIVHPGDEGDTPRAPLTYRMPDRERVIITSPGSVAIADPPRREAIAYVTPALVADRDHFRYAVLEALTLALLTRLDRQPLHTAALMRDESALLLWGASGAGKSTLCYAALRHGLALLADDIVFVQMEPRLRIWGMPGFLHLPLAASAHFPELAARAPAVLANGKEKIAVRAAEAGAVAALPFVERAGICLLERAGSRPAVARIEAAEIERTLTATVETGFDVFAGTIGPAIHQLAQHGGWRLRLGGDPAAAVTFLQGMLEELERTRH